VYYENKKIKSIGQRGMFDYPTLLQTNSKEIADKHRRNYWARHKQYDKLGEILSLYLLW